MPDLKPLQRQWTIVRMLSRQGGAAVREMADDTGVSQKTIRRDLNTLRSVGFALVEVRGSRGKKFWRLQYQHDVPHLKFDYDELAALYLGRRFLDPLAGTVFADAAHSALAKIKAGLSDSALRYLEKLAHGVYRTAFGRGDYGDKRDVVEALRTGVEDRLVTLIAYQSMRATEPVEYEVYPLALVLHRDSLYLVAFSTDHDELRHFKVDRVELAETPGFPFNLPASCRDFDLETHLATAFGIYHTDGPPTTVRLRFAADVARYVEESHWHESQKLKRQPDGSLLAEFEVTAMEEVQSWVLSFGAKAEVLEPEELRERVRNELHDTLSHYEPSRLRTATRRNR